MTRLTRLVVPFAAATALTFSGLTLAADNDKVLATVNGASITQQDYDNYLRNNSKAGNMPHDRIVDELISRELVYQDAIDNGLDKDPTVQKKIDLLRTNVILGAALDKAMNSKPVSDQELKKIYDDQIGNFDAKEYKARHILLKTKQDAEKVITELDMGADFADLAKKRSTGPSAKQGGDLGWFSPKQMLPGFSQKVVQMKKGTYTKEPVKTRFGWHVIKLEDVRSAKPPTFEQVKPKLKQLVERQRLGNYIKGLREGAKIEKK